MAAAVPLTERLPWPVQRVLRAEFLRDSAIVFGSTLAVNVLNYAIHVILSRKLGVEEYGSFASLMSVLAIFGIPSSLIVTIVAKFVAEFHAVDDKARIRLLSYRALMLGGGIAALLVLLAITLSSQIAAYLHLDATAGVIMAAVVLGLSLLSPIMRAVLQGAQDFTRLAISNVTEGTGKLVLAVGFVFAGLGVAGAFLGYAFAMLVGALVTVPFMLRHWSKQSARLTIDPVRLLHTTGGVIVATSAITVLGYVDVPIVKHFFSPTQAGIYSAVSVCGKMLFFFVAFVPTLVLPKAARRAAEGLGSGRVLLQGLLLTGALAAAALFCFLEFAPLLVRVTYGAAFLPAAQYVFAYGIAMALLAATNVVVNYKIGLHRYGFVVPLTFIAVAEPVALHAFHASLWSVIDVLIVGNAVALCGCLATGALRRTKDAVVGA
jgi:O-antigen/teichoic acid export membrane protein